MNLQEFAALKVGDRIENAMTNSRGVVTRTSDGGVHVGWHMLHKTQEFFYSVQGTAWFHWAKPETVRERNPANCEHDVAMDIFCELCEPAK